MVNVADVMQIVEDVVQRIAMVIRFISGFTMLAGAVMVASSIAGTRFRRMREVVILKTLGATRRRIAWIFSVEFLALGAVAGLMGSLLASAFRGISPETTAGHLLSLRRPRGVRGSSAFGRCGYGRRLGRKLFGART